MNQGIDIAGVALTTPRLILRPWREQDVNDFFEYASVEGVGQMAGWPPHRSIEDSKAILRRFIEGRHVLALEHQGKVVGSLGVEEYNEKQYPELDALRGREIGYVLSKAYWGQGLMPEAVQRVIRWLFDEQGLDFILVGHFAENHQSRRVIEKCGFRYVKTTKFETALGQVKDSLDYILYRQPK